ncbi:MAG: lipid-A-disaccharide synthase [Acidobacteria bacterium]|nr:lipid-A-disaccharide synthase [Acidobacteriota bacterium]
MASNRRRVLIVAGEASADRYGSSLVERLHSMHRPETLDFYGTGGDAMAKAGVRLLGHTRDLAHIGVREALAGLGTYYRIYRRLIKESVGKPPALAVLLDFPEFNLKVAKKMKRLGVPVVYYISPQIWAWRSGRIRAIRKNVDRMLVILPFEEKYYRERGVSAEYVGHPLLENFNPDFNRGAFLGRVNLDPERKTIAILAGSRSREIGYILPTLLEAARLIQRRIPAQFLISAAPSIGLDPVRNVTRRILGKCEDEGAYRILTEDSRDILANADFAFVKSGTSSLEAALVGTPFLVTYKISPLSWFIGTLLIRSPMLGLVNLIAGEKIVPELYQKRATPEALAGLALEFLEEPEKGNAMRARLAEIHEQLSARCASETAAAAVSSFL